MDDERFESFCYSVNLSFCFILLIVRLNFASYMFIALGRTGGTIQGKNYVGMALRELLIYSVLS